jgi:hypothetical protein
MPAHCSTSQPFVITGPAEIIGELLCGPAQHDEHMRGYRWHQYVADDKKRMDAVMAVISERAAERRANLTSQQRADIELAHWQAGRMRA